MTKEEILKMEAGGDLDALIAEHILGLVVEKHYLGGHLCNIYVKDTRTNILEYSTDISAAWPVVAKMFELGYAMSLLHLSSEFYPEYWYCDFRPKEGAYSHQPPEYEWVDHQMTAPIAICKAALILKLSEKGGK